MNSPRWMALHGFLGAPSDWDFLRLHRDVQTPSLLDFFKNEINTLDTAARALLQQAPRDSILMGYSLGGRLALQAALLEPAHFRAVILVSAHTGLPATAIEEREARRRSDQLWAERLCREPWSQFWSAWNAQAVFQKAPESVELQRPEPSLKERQRWAHVLQAGSLATQTEWAPHLAQLTKPVLVITGELDIKFTQHWQSLPRPAHFQHRVILGAGHRLPWQKPVEFEQCLRDFELNVVARQ